MTVALINHFKLPFVYIELPRKAPTITTINGIKQYEVGQQTIHPK
jgi:hypothetical protein